MLNSFVDAQDAYLDHKAGNGDCRTISSFILAMVVQCDCDLLKNVTSNLKIKHNLL
jgi:hypothetical protein